MAAAGRWLTLAGLAVLAAGIGLSLWLWPRDEEPSQARPVAPRVEVVAARPRPGGAYIRQTGFLRAAESTEVSSEVAARIATVSERFLPGLRVAKGHQLIGLESTTLAADLERANAQLERAIAARDRATAALRRERQLVERDFRSAASLETVRTEAATARADVAAARASVEAARTRFDGMTIVAPFDALVVEEDAARGQYVQPGAALGRLVLAAYAELPLSVRPEVFRRIGGHATLDARVPVHDPHSGRELAVGRVVAIAPALDPRTRTRELRIRIDEPFSRDPPLTLNALAEARLPLTGGAGDVYELPAAALQADQSIWTVDEREQLRELAFEMIARRDEAVLIRSDDVTPATRIVTTLMDVPVAGMGVRTGETPDRVVSR